VAQAKALKDAGNAHFVASKWDAALAEYREGLALLPERPEPPSDDSEATLQDEDSEVKELRAALHANISAVHLKKVGYSSVCPH
jgi:hypothetical protein